ncbi:hypothetical protein L2E82_05701 [Cichorium intybus]|uniref:Uncharacterized protein n=1 Tax=Cichorium intybus TaxID=13427 RepID=A0ACB9H948_CICIN|nr:hypothetical protein L2E82_05701 [Cichorium intybus]
MFKPAGTTRNLKDLAKPRECIEKDPALDRRFQPVKVPEPTADETIQILKGLREHYENHHKLWYTDEALVASAPLSYQYTRSRLLSIKNLDSSSWYQN